MDIKAGAEYRPSLCYDVQGHGAVQGVRGAWCEVRGAWYEVHGETYWVGGVGTPGHRGPGEPCLSTIQSIMLFSGTVPRLLKSRV